MKKPSTNYHFKRKNDLEKYEGEQSRLISILKMDHSEGVKSSLSSSVESEKQLISKEEFLRRAEDGIRQKQDDDH